MECIALAACVGTRLLLVERKFGDAAAVAIFDAGAQLKDLHRRRHALREIHHAPDDPTHLHGQEDTDRLPDHERLLGHGLRLPRILFPLPSAAALFAATAAALFAAALLRHVWRATLLLGRPAAKRSTEQTSAAAEPCSRQNRPQEG